MDLYNSLSQVRTDLEKGVISCRELVDFYLERIREHQHLNAFVEVYENYARQEAIRVDTRLKEGRAGRLAGMVIGFKDVICLKDQRITAASNILNNFQSLYTATALQRILDEDAIVIGRLNCDEFAMGSSNENSRYGPVKNARDPEKVPGGSSGGSAVAVQANLCLASLGTDTGGSIRQPSSFCGTIGLKPTYGRVSRYGLIAYASSFDQIGTFTRSVEDAALLLEIMAGKDPLDSTSSSTEVSPYSAMLEADKKYRIAYYPQTLQHEKIDPEIAARSREILDELRAQGHQVDAIDFEYLDYVVPAYYILTTAEASSNLARYDGVRYGYRNPEATNMDDVHTLSRSEGFGVEVKRRIMLGTFVLSSGYYDAYYTRAQKVRRLIYEKSREILDNHDFIFMPTTPTTAFGLGEKLDDPVEMYLADIFTVQANLAGLPAVSLPLGQHSNKMPFGIQLISNSFTEAKLLAFSHYLMQHIGSSLKVLNN